MFSSEFCDIFPDHFFNRTLVQLRLYCFYHHFVIFRIKRTMERKYQLLTIFALLGLIMITVYVSIFGSYKPILFKFTFTSITIRDSQSRFSVSKNITTTLTFLQSKYNLIIKLIPEAGLGNRLFMYASALGIAIENSGTLGVYSFPPEMEASLRISSPWV